MPPLWAPAGPSGLVAQTSWHPSTLNTLYGKWSTALFEHHNL